MFYYKDGIIFWTNLTDANLNMFIVFPGMEFIPRILYFLEIKCRPYLSVQFWNHLDKSGRMRQQSVPSVLWTTKARLTFDLAALLQDATTVALLPESGRQNYCSL